MDNEWKNYHDSERLPKRNQLKQPQTDNVFVNNMEDPSAPLSPSISLSLSLSLTHTHTRNVLLTWKPWDFY